MHSNTNQTNNLETKTIGIIGYGNFGKVICKYLFPQNRIVLYTSQSLEEIPAHRIIWLRQQGEAYYAWATRY